MEDYNIESLSYLIEFINSLVKRSMVPVSFKVYSNFLGKISYINVTDYKSYLIFLQSYIKSASNPYGYNILIIDNLTIEIQNLKRWGAYFDVYNLSNKLRINDRKLNNNFIQPQINLEIERYKNFLQNEIQIYLDKINSIVLWPPIDSKESYVDGFYVDVDFVFPQIN